MGPGPIAPVIELSPALSAVPAGDIARTAPAIGSRLPFLLKFGWGIGAIGAVAMMIIASLLLLYFMVSVLGMSPALAGLLLGAVRIFDMVVDPTVGFLSDRTRSRWGRRRPWMLAGAIGSGLATLVLFSVPVLPSTTLLTLYVGCALVFFYLTYSMFYVPFIAMPAEMTDDYNERTSIMAYRTAFSGVAGLLGMGVVPLLLAKFGSTRAGFAHMAWIIAACIAATMLVSVAMTGGARHIEIEKHVSLRDSLATLRNRNFTALLATKLVALFAIAAGSAVGLLYQGYYTTRGPKGLAILGFCAQSSTIVFIPMFLRLAKRYDKRTLLIASLVGFALVSLSWLASGPTEPDAIFVARGIGFGICYAGVVLLTLSMLPDVTADEQRRTGQQVGGAMAGLFSMVEKLAWALAPVASGVVLSLTGFVAGKDTTAPQTSDAIRGLVVANGVLPAVAFLIAIPLIFRYRLTRAAIARGNGGAA
jgi:GPH family glycoside/pentoside/hexuronide:cation symporter